MYFLVAWGFCSHVRRCPHLHQSHRAVERAVMLLIFNTINLCALIYRYSCCYFWIRISLFVKLYHPHPSILFKKNSSIDKLTYFEKVACGKHVFLHMSCAHRFGEIHVPTPNSGSNATLNELTISKQRILRSMTMTPILQSKCKWLFRPYKR